MTAEEAKGVDDYPLFDWLRITLAMIVAASHFSLITWEFAGNLSVQVFFSLSGWLIGSILLEMRKGALPLFYFNRTTRVWFPYFFTLLILYGASSLKDTVNVRWFEFLLYDVTFTHNFFTLLPNFQQAISEMPLKGTGNHLWSLSVEEQFYLVSPLLISRFHFAKSYIFWIAISLLTFIVRQEFTSIALGVAAAAANRQFPRFYLNASLRIAFYVTAAVLTLALLFLPSYYDLVAPVFSISIVLIAALPGKRDRLGKFLGGVSYPLYLNHWVALVGVSIVAKRLGGNPLFWAVFGTFLAFVVGALAYIVIDKTVLKYRRQWYSTNVGWVCAITAYSLVGTGILVGLLVRVI